MNKKILIDLEIAIELEELKQLGMDDSEITGFIEVFCDSWELELNNGFEN